MPRTVPSTLITDLRGPSTTMGFLLRFAPRNGSPFGLTSANADIPYDDGDGLITYRCAHGFTPSDTVTKSDLSVNNAEANSLIAQYPLDGVTMDAILRGDYDGARFKQYLINYNRLTPGLHSIISAGTIGQIARVDDIACQIELRSLFQTLKQTSMVELTSLSCRAKFGDNQCKLPFAWNAVKVQSVGAEADRTFNICAPDGTAFTFADGYFKPGIAVWTSGANEGFEIEVEEFVGATQTVTLVFPVPTDIQVGDLLNIRRDCAKSKAACIAYGNIINMRAEPEIPVGSGMDLQAPTPQGDASQ